MKEVITSILTVALGFLVLITILWSTWNGNVRHVFDLPAITFYQAGGITLLMLWIKGTLGIGGKS